MRRAAEVSRVDPLNLTGRWSGQYAYLIPRAPVAFSASLEETGGWLSGASEEIATGREALGRALTATLQGKREGRHVRFLKLYDSALRTYDSVAYEGRLSADGREIAGRWSIPGNWFGSFVMTRQGGGAAEVERREEEKV